MIFKRSLSFCVRSIVTCVIVYLFIYFFFTFLLTVFALKSFVIHKLSYVFSTLCLHSIEISPFHRYHLMELGHKSD